MMPTSIHITSCTAIRRSPYGGKDRVVGYHSFIFTRDEVKPVESRKRQANFSLTDEDKKMLKEITSDAIRMTLEGRSYQFPSHLSEKLKTLCGAFVSLNKHGRLRGCIGHFGEDMPLYKTVSQMAKAAAFEDPRFPAVNITELPDIDIEISVLTPMKRIHSIDKFQLGKQGIYMRKGNRAGTFLPQICR